MARKDRIYMPLGVGGLLRYHEEEEILSIKPEKMIFIILGIIFLELLLKFFG